MKMAVRAGDLMFTQPLHLENVGHHYFTGSASSANGSQLSLLRSTASFAQQFFHVVAYHARLSAHAGACATGLDHHVIGGAQCFSFA